MNQSAKEYKDGRIKEYHRRINDCINKFIMNEPINQSIDKLVFIFAGYVQDKKDGRLKGAVDHHRREEELLEEEVQPHSSPLSTEFIPVLLFTR